MIRKANIKDIPAIREMANVVFRKTYAKILSPQQMEYMMDWMYSQESLLKQMTILGHVFYIDGNKGYVSFRYDRKLEDGTELYHLEKLYVMPEYQGTGLGLRLFNIVVESVKKLAHNHARIELNVNRYNTAVTFYEHLGMYKAETGDFPIGMGFYMNDYIMALDLK